LYQEETYESNDDEAREAAQLADEDARFEYEAEEMQAGLWAGPLVLLPDASPLALPARSITRIKEVA
jgi:CRISPR/Cas system CMR subunit Cmr4 (Cas7 group RAMP superfamily)